MIMNNYILLIRKSDLVDYIKSQVSDKDIVGLTQNEYDYLVSSGNIKP